MFEQVKSPVLVAEISGNHMGSLDRALDLIDLAARSGADAVKIQTYTEDSLTLNCQRPEFLIKGGLWDGYNLYDLYQNAKTPPHWLPELFSFAKNRGIFLFSSPFSPEDVEALEDVDCPAYKIASFELNYPDLIAQCAQTGKPIIMSTGLGTLEEIERAVNHAVKNGCKDLTLLYCVSRYPAPPESFNLNAIPFYKEHFGCRAGLSSHALSLTIDVAAAALGADLIEKHFVDDRDKGSVDAAFSMEPDEWHLMAEETRIAATAAGKKGVCLQPEDLASRKGRRSVYLTAPLKKGEKLTRAHVRVVRPGYGLDPFELDSVLGHEALSDLEAPQPLKREFFA